MTRQDDISKKHVLLGCKAAPTVANWRRMQRAPISLTWFGVTALAVVTVASASDDPLVFVQPPYLGEAGVCESQPLETATLRELRGHLRVGDDKRAAEAATALVRDTTDPSTRDAALFSLATLAKDAHDDDKAIALWHQVASARGPLADFARVEEAEGSFRLGHWPDAVAICARDKSADDNPLAARCQRVVALSHAALGHQREARAAAVRHDEDNRLGPIGEAVERALILRLSQLDPQAAIPELQRLVWDHNAPLTGRIAEERLLRLSAQGWEASLPTDPASQARRAIRLREDNRRDDAWLAFEQLRPQRDDVPWLGRWIDGSVERFASKTHRWDELLRLWRANWTQRETASAAWGQYRVLVRAGDHKAAAEWIRTGNARFASSSEWRHKEEELARNLVRAGDTKTAVRILDEAARRGGTSARRAELLAAIASVAGEKYDDALRRLDRVIAADPSGRTAAHYWRWRSLVATGGDPAPDAAEVRRLDPHGWYAAMLDSPDGIRDGSWPDADTTEVVPPSPAWIPTWTEAPPSILVSDGEQPPSAYPSGTWFDETQGFETLAALAARHRDWPGLKAAHDLASVGLYDLAGPLIGHLWEENRRGQLRGARSETALSWRTLFWTVRDHHHSARTTSGLWSYADTPREAEDAWRLGWPVAHERILWRAAADADIDPYLVLGLMRQESTYATDAKSPVGARGAMQVMPRTGNLLADLRDDRLFTPADLEDPVVAVRFGVDYLGRLSRRFSGAWPVAIAAYNAGPTQVGSWLPSTPMPMDLWVELIPIRETRDYVRKVGAGYARYLTLYGDDGATVAVPATTRPDLGPMVIDF